MGTTQPPSTNPPPPSSPPPHEDTFPEVRSLLEAKSALQELCQAAGSSDLDGRGALVRAQLDRFHQLVTLMRVQEALSDSRLENFRTAQMFRNLRIKVFGQ